MPLFMDTYQKVDGLAAEVVARAHKMDLAVEESYGVEHVACWFNEQLGCVYCLLEAPSEEAAQAVHREAHCLLADEFVEVQRGS